MNEDKGLFITLEGGEGSGKSTLIKMMKKTFEDLGHEVIDMREPGGSEFAEELRQIFLKYDDLSGETAALLLNSIRADNIEKIIQPALNAGMIVISDRFSASSLVYQGLLTNSYDTVRRITKNIPMISMFVDVPPKIGLERISSNDRTTNRLDKMPLSKHEEIYDGYKKLGSLEPDVYWDVILDGTLSIEDLNAQVKDNVILELSTLLNKGYGTTSIKKEIRRKGQA